MASYRRKTFTAEQCLEWLRELELLRWQELKMSFAEIEINNNITLSSTASHLL